MTETQAPRDRPFLTADSSGAQERMSPSAQRWMTHRLGAFAESAKDPVFSRLLLCLLVAIGYMVSGKLGLVLAIPPGFATPVWFPSGLALAAVLLWGQPVWPGIWLGSFCVNVTTLFDHSTALAIAKSIGLVAVVATGSTVQASAAAWLMSRLNGSCNPFNSVDRTLRFVGIAVISCLIAPTVGVAVLAEAGHVRWSTIGSTWMTWWLGDLAGILIVTPLPLTWLESRWPKWDSRRLGEAITLVISLFLLGQVLFANRTLLALRIPPLPLRTLLMPFIVWAAIRFGQRGVVLAILMISAMAIAGTLVEQDTTVELNVRLLFLQAFISTMSLTGLVLAAAFTERQQAEEALRESEARKGAILESSLDGILSIDRRGKIIEWNQAAESLFGYSREQAIGREMAALIIPESLREKHRQGMKHYLLTGQTSVIGRQIEMPARRADGGGFSAELTITRIEAPGPPIFTGFIRDITHRKAAELERQELLTAERAARSESQRAGQVKDEFVATLSHELRTPMHAILGWTQLARRGTMKPPEIEQALGVIERNARLQAQLIDDLLDINRLSTGKLHLEIRAVDLVQTVEAAIQSVQHAAESKGVTIERALQPLQPINADPRRIQQVIWNLLTNAIKFTPKGGSVRVQLRPVDGCSEIVVRDTGQGIPPEFLPHVFERFRQADASSTRAHGGLGIGLAITRQLVELHGGVIQAESAGVGQGATFTVSLPAGAPALNQPGDLAADAAGVQLDLTDLSVLAVDDEEDTRAVIKQLLEQAGARVRTAASGAEALAMLEQLQPDVLLSDIGMPDEDGYTLIRKVRASERGGKMPAVALTAYTRTEDRARAIECGYDAYLPKPIEAMDLLATVATLAHRTAGAVQQHENQGLE